MKRDFYSLPMDEERFDHIQKQFFLSTNVSDDPKMPSIRIPKFSSVH